jgi:CHC2 zinc finger
LNADHARRVYDFQHIKHVVPLEAVLEHYGILSELKRIGTQLFGTCPIHQGKNRKQFVCDLDKQVWRCFGDCDRGGSTLELVAEIERVEIPEAARLIADWFAVGSGRRTSVRVQPQKRRTPMSGKPSHKVYVTRGEGDDQWWTRIGSAWPVKGGISIQLDAHPIGDRLVLREVTEDEKEEDKKGAYRKK